VYGAAGNSRRKGRVTYRVESTVCGNCIVFGDVKRLVITVNLVADPTPCGSCRQQLLLLSRGSTRFVSGKPKSLKG